eukprot:UN11146
MQTFSQNEFPTYLIQKMVEIHLITAQIECKDPDFFEFFLPICPINYAPYQQ